MRRRWNGSAAAGAHSHTWSSINLSECYLVRLSLRRGSCRAKIPLSEVCSERTASRFFFGFFCCFFFSMFQATAIDLK